MSSLSVLQTILISFPTCFPVLSISRDALLSTVRLSDEAGCMHEGLATSPTIISKRRCTISDYSLRILLSSCLRAARSFASFLVIKSNPLVLAIQSLHYILITRYAIINTSQRYIQDRTVQQFFLAMKIDKFITLQKVEIISIRGV